MDNNTLKTVHLEKHELPFAISEEMKTLRTNIQLCGVDKRVILVTSTINSEGKTQTTLNLCRSFAEQGKKVLLIDADMRKSVLRTRIIKGPVERGLADYLSGNVELSEVLCRTETPGMYVIFAGSVPPNPTELMSNDNMKSLIAFARDHFDYVLLDCAPLGMVIDAAVVAQYCDGSLIVIESALPKYKAVQRVAETLKNTDCPILGVVLNKVDRKKNARNYGRYYGNYNNTYNNKK